MNAIATPKWKDTPLLLKGPLVLKTRSREKTMTRRPLEQQPVLTYMPPTRAVPERWNWQANSYPLLKDGSTAMKDSMLKACPYGGPGDKLWIRESMKMNAKGVWVYSADEKPVLVDPKDASEMKIWAHHRDQDYCPSIHMPRWACRVRCRITEVRVEQITDITVEDIIAEGFSTRLEEHDACVELRDHFEKAWNELYPQTPFAPHTWVYALRYRLIRG